MEGRIIRSAQPLLLPLIYTGIGGAYDFWSCLMLGIQKWRHPVSVDFSKNSIWKTLFGGPHEMSWWFQSESVLSGQVFALENTPQHLEVVCSLSPDWPPSLHYQKKNWFFRRHTPADVHLAAFLWEFHWGRVVWNCDVGSCQCRVCKECTELMNTRAARAMPAPQPAWFGECMCYCRGPLSRLCHGNPLGELSTAKALWWSLQRLKGLPLDMVPPR